MNRPCFVSVGSGRFFRHVNGRGKFHRVKTAIAVKLPSVFIPAPLYSNMEGIVHLNSMCLCF